MICGGLVRLRILKITNKQNTNRKALRNRSTKRKNGSGRASDMAHVSLNPITRFNPVTFGFPDRLMTTLRYHNIVAVSSVAGATGKQVYSWNSIYDPDITNVGHQPLYRDTYAAIYDHYAVVSARARVRITNPNSTSFLTGVVTDDDSTTSSSIDTLSEQNHGMHILLQPLSGSRSEVEYNLSWDCKKILGVDPYTSMAYKTAVGSDPTETSTLTIWGADVTGSTNGLLTDIIIEYDVLFTELSTPVQS